MAIDPTRGLTRAGGPMQAAQSSSEDATHASVPARAGTAQLPPPPRLPPLPASDEELFMLYVTTDSDRALREVVNRYEPKIQRYFLRNSATRSRADDLTQEVFIRIIRNRASFDPSRKFSTWSKTIAERIAINTARGAQRSRVTSFTDLASDPEAQPSNTLDPADPEMLPDQIAEQSELRGILDEALSHVDERYRLPAVLHFLEGLTHTEAAKRLGIPVGTAKSRTHHAVADLRNLLRERGLAAA